MTIINRGKPEFKSNRTSSTTIFYGGDHYDCAVTCIESVHAGGIIVIAVPSAGSLPDH